MNRRATNATKPQPAPAGLYRRAAQGPDRPSVSGLVHGVLGTSGHPLDDETRGFMQRRLGHDFSLVRVHTDTAAAESARAVNALAYTVGSDIVFGAGQYAPQSSSGRAVLAHELVHVIQQSRSGAPTSVATLGRLRVSRRDDPAEREAETLAMRALAGDPPSVADSTELAVSRVPGDVLQRQESTEPAAAIAPAPYSSGTATGPALQLPEDEAALRVNEALDKMTGLTYIRRPARPAIAVASNEPTPAEPAESPELQTFPDLTLYRAGGGSALSNISAGVVGSLQICWDCLTGAASLKGWIWAGVGYEAPIIGWLGGYFFGEKTWWLGNLGNLFEPGKCDAGCGKKQEGKTQTELGWGIAGFPLKIEPGTKARMGKAGLEVGILLTPHSLCDADVEIIALLNVLAYLGPVATIVTNAVDGLNALTRDTPHFSLAAGIDASATFHFCRGANSLLAVDSAAFCGGGYVEAGLGLSHSKSGNHGAT